jgi:hypothetical protein
MPTKGKHQEKAEKSVKKPALQKKAGKPAKKLLAKVPAEYVFWCHDGAVFTDIYDLLEGLKTMSDETFAYHSNLEKHDFSNWIRAIMGDEELADALMMVTSRPEAVSCVIARINA